MTTQSLYAVQIWNDLKGGGNIFNQAVNESGSSQMPGKDGGPYDAYRHLLWTAELTRRYGETVARAIADLHELDGNIRGGQAPEFEKMDRQNNEVGIDIGRNVRSWEEVVSRSRQEIGRTAETGWQNPSPNAPVQWLPVEKWRRSEVDPNPAPLDANQRPLPRDQWNLPTLPNGVPTWPSNSYPLPPNVDAPPNGNFTDSFGWDFNFLRPLKFMAPGIYIAFQAALNWRRPGDPLILDLDGDGIELTASNSAVLFDHNADGVKTGTQWARADDGILVRDVNGNGLIDSGRELFGDQTVYTEGPLAGQTAANGFAALSALDKVANGISDGIFNANDTAHADLKRWRDLNQDGISQSNELQTLAGAGVTAINLTQTPTQVTQGKSTFTKTAKTVAGLDANDDPVTTSTEQTAQNVNFTTNNFYRAFSDDPSITTEAANLPQMQGAGLVRDLREVMSLVDTHGQATAQATALSQQVSTFGNASSAAARQVGLETLINAWGATSSLVEARVRTPDQGLGFLDASGGAGGGDGGNVGRGSGARPFPTGYAVANFARSEPGFYAKLTALERFNGQAILERYARQVSGQHFYPPTQTWRTYTTYTLVIEAPRRAFFEQAYESLKQSVYQSLYLQMAGKELLDQVELAICEKKRSFRLSAFELTLACRQKRILIAIKRAVFDAYYARHACIWHSVKRAQKRIDGGIGGSSGAMSALRVVTSRSLAMGELAEQV